MLATLAATLVASHTALAQRPSDFLMFNLTLPGTSGMVGRSGHWDLYRDDLWPSANLSLYGRAGAPTNEQDIGSLNFVFGGTAIYIGGRVTNARDIYLMTSGVSSRIDNWSGTERIPGSSAVMGPQDFAVTAYGTLNVSTKAGNAVGWFVNNVTFTTGLLSDAPSFDDVPKTTQYFAAGNALNPNFTWTPGSGSWASAGPVDEDDSQMAAEASGITRIPMNLPTVSIPVPQNTSFVVINGTKGAYHGVGLEINPRLAWTPSRLNANCTETVSFPNEILFFSPLDPTIKHSLRLLLRPSPASNETSTAVMRLNSVTFYSGSFNPKNISSVSNSTTGTSATNSISLSSSQTSSTNGGDTSNSTVPVSAVEGKKVATGVIAGVVVAAVIALLAIVFLTWYLATKRVQRNRQRLLDDQATFEVDDTVVAPFAVPAAEVGYAAHMLSSEGSTSATAQVPSGQPFFKNGVLNNPPAAIAPMALHATDSAQLPPLYDPRWADTPGPVGMEVASGQAPLPPQDPKAGARTTPAKPAK